MYMYMYVCRYISITYMCIYIGPTWEAPLVCIYMYKYRQ